MSPHFTTRSTATCGEGVDGAVVGVAGWAFVESGLSNSRGRYLSLVLPRIALLVTTEDVVGVRVVDTVVTVAVAATVPGDVVVVVCLLGSGCGGNLGMDCGGVDIVEAIKDGVL